MFEKLINGGRLLGTQESGTKLKAKFKMSMFYLYLYHRYGTRCILKIKELLRKLLLQQMVHWKFKNKELLELGLQTVAYKIKACRVEKVAVKILQFSSICTVQSRRSCAPSQRPMTSPSHDPMRAVFILAHPKCGPCSFHGGHRVQLLNWGWGSPRLTGYEYYGTTNKQLERSGKHFK